MVTTPSGFEQLFPATGGALYGRTVHGWQASFQRPGARTRLPGLYLAGGSVHPGAGVPMAAMSGQLAAECLMADLASTRRFLPNGYAWWYVDGLSDDGRHGLTVIAFIGSVFSPWYAWARRRGPADPLQHCAVNVALYGAGKRRWTMTERGASAIRRDARTLSIGPSAVQWNGTSLTLELAEIGAPWPRRVRGIVRVHPLALGDRGFLLDAAGRHRWRPIAPRARIEVALDSPHLRWSGTGYFDTNDGDAPLESDFRDWDWCRASAGDAAAILYNARRRDGDAAIPGPAGRPSRPDRGHRAATLAELPRTAWRLRRPTRADAGTAPRVMETLQDAPFYARSVIATGLLGQPVVAVHESLDLDRFAALPVQMMLPFRVPRSVR